MNITILGGGFTGLSAAYYLSKKGHNILLLESAPVLGGLAAGFTGEGWEWPLERAYHHIFSTDVHIQNMLNEAGFQEVILKTPITASLYEEGGSLKTYPMDSPLALLKFPLLTLGQRVRAGMTLALLRFFPFIPALYEHITGEKLVGSLMGRKTFETLFGEMFRRKFGKYAGNILASFFWARIHERTQTLGYMKGGFQSAVDHLANVCSSRGVQIQTGTKVSHVAKKGKLFEITYADHKEGEKKQEAEIVISTLPSATLAQIGKDILQNEEIARLQKLRHLSAINIILETKEPIFDKEYWVSVCAPNIPGLVFVQHTNLIDKSHYANHHLLYAAAYCEASDPILTQSKEEVLSRYLPHLEMIAKKPITTHTSYLWKADNAQPIFDKIFLENKPQFTTSAQGFFIANLDMTYPYDRGTNYAVKLGREVAARVNALGE